MGFTVAVYATHKNWREYVMNETAAPGKPLGLVPQLNDARQRLDEVKQQRERVEAELEQEKTFKRQALAQLENENDELQQRLDQREKEYARADQDRREAVGALEATNQRLKAQTEEIERLRTQIRQVQGDRDDKTQQVVELTDKLHQGVLAYQALKETHDILSADHAEAVRRLRVSGLPEPPQAWIDQPAPQGVEGVVLGVGGSGSQLEISIGTDDGIRKGHQLEVKRGPNYLGRIEIIQTAPDKAVAKIVPGMQQGPIQRGDRVFSSIRS
jgi:hypothetical protein